METTNLAVFCSTKRHSSLLFCDSDLSFHLFQRSLEANVGLLGMSQVSRIAGKNLGCEGRAVVEVCLRRGRADVLGGD